jgi:hypothetical protein
MSHGAVGDRPSAAPSLRHFCDHPAVGNQLSDL